MFKVIHVPDDVADTLEPLGTKRKFWFYGDGFVKYLFKEITPNTGDDWSEKIACELCELVGLPHVPYELAIWRGKRGVVATSIVPAGGRLVHGNEFLSKVIHGYPMRQFFRVRQYTLGNVLAIMKLKIFYPPLDFRVSKDINSAIAVFIGYLMLDAWIANQDRHHENWSFLVTEESRIHLAPTFDHASGLGRNETDKNRSDRLQTRDKQRMMDRYVEKATSPFYSSPTASKPMSTLEAFYRASKTRPAAGKAWIERLESVSPLGACRRIRIVLKFHAKSGARTQISPDTYLSVTPKRAKFRYQVGIS